MARLFFDAHQAGQGQLRPLPARGRVIIGSDERADVRLTAAGVFAEAARFDVETLTLTAIAPGVEVDQRPVPAGLAVELEAGARVKVGEAMLTLMVWRSLDARAISPHDYFERRGWEEATRAARKKLEFSVLQVRLGARSRTDEIESGLASTVRATDVISVYGPGVYDLLLFESDGAGAQLVASRIHRVLEQIDMRCRVGVASFPANGTTIDELSAYAARMATGAPDTADDQTQVFDPSQTTVVERVAVSELSILILGETGSGKELLAARVTVQVG